MKPTSPFWPVWATLLLCGAFAFAVDWDTIYSVTLWEWAPRASHWLRWVAWGGCISLMWLGLCKCVPATGATLKMLFVSYGLLAVAFALAGSFSKDEGLIWTGALELATFIGLGAAFGAFNSGLVLALLFLRARFSERSVSRSS